MTYTTPAQARAFADDFDHMQGHITVKLIRGLAEQLEVMTEERDNAVASAKYTADLCTQALADLKAVTAERDAYKLDAERYRFVKSGILSLDCIRKTFNDSSNGTDKSIDEAIAKEAK